MFNKYSEKFSENLNLENFFINTAARCNFAINILRIDLGIYKYTPYFEIKKGHSPILNKTS